MNYGYIRVSTDKQTVENQRFEINRFCKVRLLPPLGAKGWWTTVIKHARFKNMTTAARKPRIYLETTLFNYYLDKGRDAHADTVKLFAEIATGKYEAFTSTYVTDELGNAPQPKRDKMMGIITRYDIAVLAPTDEAARMADLYVAEGVVPRKFRTDGLHIAIATVNALDMIVSLNFKHIVKRRTILATGKINVLNGYHAVEIYSPMEVVDNEEA